MVVLDTSIIIGLRRGDQSCINAVEHSTDRGEPFTITSITLFELADGIARSNQPAAEQARINAILHSQRVLNLDAASAQLAGQLHANLYRKGTPIGAADCMIAGIAIANNEPLLTLNPKDFKRVPGLTVQTPAQAHG